MRDDSNEHSEMLTVTALTFITGRDWQLDGDSFVRPAVVVDAVDRGPRVQR